MAILNSYVSLPEGKSCEMFINYGVSHIDKSPLNFKKRLNFIIFRPSLWDSWLYILHEISPLFCLYHTFFGDSFLVTFTPTKMSNCLGRGCATQLLLQGSHALRCVFVLLIGVLQRFCILAGKNWLAVARHFPEKRSKVRDLTGLIAVDCPLTLRKFHGFSPSKGNWEMQPKWFFLCRANEEGCVAQEELMKTNGYRKYAAKWGV